MAEQEKPENPGNPDIPGTPEDSETQPSYDRWSLPEALSGRGYVLAVLVPVLIAAVAFGAVALFASDDDGLSGTTVRLPVSGYAPDNDDGALIEGVLRLDSDHCVYLETGQDGGAVPGRTYVVWPAGFKATREGSGLTVYDVDGRAVAHEGDRVRTSGSVTPVGTFAGEPCLPGSGDVAVVQSDVTVVR